MCFFPHIVRARVHLSFPTPQGFGNTFGRWPAQTRAWLPADQLRPATRLARRGRYVVAALRSSLAALAFLHESGMVHRSLGPSSLLLAAADDMFRMPKLRSGHIPEAKQATSS